MTQGISVVILLCVQLLLIICMYICESVSTNVLTYISVTTKFTSVATWQSL